MPAKFYVATTLDNADQAKLVSRRLSDFGHELTYDWTVHGRVYDQDLKKEIAIKEVNGVLEADVLVMLWPGQRGTHVEFGVALATNKPVFFIVPPEFNIDISFYNHPNVLKFDNLDKAIEVIHKHLSVFESEMQ